MYFRAWSSSPTSTSSISTSKSSWSDEGSDEATDEGDYDPLSHDKPGSEPVLSPVRLLPQLLRVLPEGFASIRGRVSSLSVGGTVRY